MFLNGLLTTFQNDLQIGWIEMNECVIQVCSYHISVSDLQSEMDNLARRLLYMKEVTSDLQSNVSALKNATHKAKAEKRQAEQQKLQQVRQGERQQPY